MQVGDTLKVNRGRVTYRIIDGTRYCCHDIGCDDLERAEYNRFIVKNKMFTTFYEMMDSWFAHTPLKQPLPDWMPIGELPEVSKGRRQEYGGEEIELSLVEEPIVVGS